MTPDIIEGSRAEEYLRQRFDLINALVGHAADGLYTVDTEGHFAFINPAAARMLGWPAGEILGRHVHETIHFQRPDGTPYPAEACPLLNVLRSGQSVSEHEEAFTRRDGSLLPVLCSSAPIIKGGQVTGAVMSFHDITARKQAEDALRESEDRYRTLFSSVPVAVFACDRNAVIQYYNRRAVELWGREPTCGVEQHCGSVNLYLPDGTRLPHPQSPIVEVLRTGIPANNVEVFIERPDGSRIAVIVNFAALKDARGDIIGAITTFDDITELKRAEEALWQSAERFRFLAESMPQKIFTALPNGEVDYFNQQWTKFTGLSFEEIKDWGWTQFIHTDDLEENVRRWQHSIDTGESFQFEHRFRRADGEYRWHLSRAQAMRDAEGSVLMWIGSNTDIEDVKRAQEERAQLLERESQAHREAEAARQRLHDLFMQAPAVICVLRGPQHTFELANPLYLQLIGRHDPQEVLDKPVREVLPEIEGQGYFENLDQVYGTGEPFIGNEMPVKLDRAGDGTLDEVFVNFVYQPTRDPSGKIDGIMVHAVEITEQVRARWQVEELAARLQEERDYLRASEEQFRRAIEDAPIPVIMHAEDGQVLQISKTWTLLTGYRTEDIPTFESWLTRAYGFGADEARRRVERLFAGEPGVVEVEFNIITRLEENRIWSFSASSPGRLRDGRRFVVSMALDITERKMLEQQITGQNVILEALALGKPLEEILPLTIEAIERQLPGSLSSVLLANDDATQLFCGATRSLPNEYNAAIDGIVIGESVGSCGTAAFRRETVIVSDTARDPLWKDFRDLALAHDLRACWSHPIISPAGKLLGTFATYFRVPRQPRTEELKMLESAARVTGIAIERKQAEEAVRESEERLRLATAAAEMFSWEVDLQAQRIKWSSNAADVIGCSPDELTDDSQNGTFFVLPEDREHLQQEFEQCMNEGKDTYILEFRGFNQTNEPKAWLAQGLIIRDAAGNPVRAIGVTQNITERKRAEEERERLLERERAARATAEEASRLKDEFLATVSHELRTPLNAILGWATMLRGGKIDGELAARGLETIERNARSQARLIEDLLDVSRVITGKLRLDIQPVDLPSVIQAAVDVVRPAAAAKEVRLQLLLDPGAGPVSGDPNRLQQVVWNLLSNAVKFTPKYGRVQVRLERVNSHVEVIVSDTGQGISQEFLPYVFDRFRQADSSYTRKSSGLGLGLAIVRQLVELHGGAVSAQSAGENQGATFTVTLPLIIAHDTGRFRVDSLGREKVTSPAGMVLDQPPSLEGLRLLLVEDEQDARDVVRLMLERCGAEVKAASGVAEALTALAEFKPHVLVSDIEMPDEDGYSLIRKVRSLGAEQGGRVPAVALTAHARAEDRLRALSTGYDAHVAKPVELAELATVIASLARRGLGT